MNIFRACKRELWLHFHNVNMEQTSDIVYEGKLIGETTYTQRPEKYTEVEISVGYLDMNLNAKIDFYDAKNKIVHEVKKSDKLEHAHIAQVKFYLYLLEKNGVQGCKGTLEYPKLKQTHHIEELNEVDKKEIETWILEIKAILEQKKCPELVKKTYCKSCSYHDFCFIGE